MDAMSALPSADVEPKEPVENAEYDNLLDINEKQDFPTDKFEPSKVEAIDIEAGHPKPEADEVPTSKLPRAPLSHEEARTLRIKAMDNIRTAALSLIILQNAAIQAVSTHRQAAELHETWPKSFISINLFVGMTRLLASDVMAWLGLETMALAWLFMALA
ncbi:hypothetical protein BJ912DRAFT_1112338 [Pholiota molesta]|nr:hypothetical protein BJ912DRAFT_1112338 [Pholiota molesta]